MFVQNIFCPFVWTVFYFSDRFHLNRYDLSNNSWLTIPSKLPDVLWDFALVKHGSALYILGGEIDLGASTTASHCGHMLDLNTYILHINVTRLLHSSPLKGSIEKVRAKCLSKISL